MTTPRVPTSLKPYPGGGIASSGQSAAGPLPQPDSGNPQLQASPRFLSNGQACSNYVPAHVQYGRFLQSRLGRNDEAMKQMAYAAELDPSDHAIRAMVGLVTYAARQYDSAISQFKEVNAAYPGMGDFGLSLCYREKKMYPEPIAALERVAVVDSLHRPTILSSLAAVYGLAGGKREALKLIDELKEKSRQHYIPASLFAEAYMGVSEDEAMNWLERAYEEHDQWMVYINSYPGYDALRSDPRFQALVRRMNFPQ